MFYTRPFLIFFLILPLFTLIIFTFGCPPPKKPAVTGTGQAFVTSGSADDGDDQTTGPPKQYIDPARTARDGLAVAVSAPISFKRLRGNVTAQTGQQSTRFSSSISTNKTTSTFVVNNPVTCRFQISSTASANLNNGRGGYLVVARILDNTGQFVAGTDFQTRYDFKLNPNGRIDVSQDNKLFTQIDNGGFISPTDIGPIQLVTPTPILIATPILTPTPAVTATPIVTATPVITIAPFVLQPGTYTLQFELNIDARANRSDLGITSAVIDVNATVDLI